MKEPTTKMVKQKVIEERLPISEKEKAWLSSFDFADTFSTTNHVNNIKEISYLIFNTSPAWVETLFSIRNRFAGWFGLRTTLPVEHNEAFRVGGYLKFFKIFSISENEVVLGADDTHLNFRTVLRNDNSERYNIKVTTMVEYNNSKGKIYMNVIKPFHRQVVKRLVGNAFNLKPPVLEPLEEATE